MVSIAQDIATAVRAKLLARGTKLPAYLDDNLSAICQLFINISAGTRSAIRAFLTAQDAQLRVYLATFVSWSTKADILSKQISILRQGATATLEQVDQVMTTLGLDSVVKQSPDLSNLLKSITEALPIKIPTTVATSLAGVGGFNFFEGVTDYKSLRNKLDDLVFDAARAVAFSNYANQANDYAKDILNRIEVYITIIDSLDIPITAVEITPTTLDFGNVPVAIAFGPILPVAVHNPSTGIVAFSWALTGNAAFSIVGVPEGQTSVTLYAPITYTLNVQFTPSADIYGGMGTRFGFLTITHDAAVGTSPVTIAIQGRGI
jgi:hypothetical protein